MPRTAPAIMPLIYIDIIKNNNTINGQYQSQAKQPTETVKQNRCSCFFIGHIIFFCQQYHFICIATDRAGKK